MPTVKIPVTRFRELQMGPTEKDFIHHFGTALVERGFRMVPGRWMRDPDSPVPRVVGMVNKEGTSLVPLPALAYDRQSDPNFLIVSQSPAGRVHDKDMRLIGLLNQVKAGSPNAVPQLYAFLLSEGDDRATVLSNLTTDVPEDALMTPDSGESKGRRMESPGDDLISSEKLAEKFLLRKILLLFGAIEEVL